MSTPPDIEMSVDDENLEHHQQNSAKLMDFFCQREIQEKKAIVRSVLHDGDPMVLWPGMEPNELLKEASVQPPVFTSSDGQANHTDSNSSQPFHQQFASYRTFNRRYNQQNSMYQHPNYNRQRSYNGRALSVTEQTIIHEIRQVRRISYVDLLDRTTVAVSNFCTVDEGQFRSSMDRLVDEGQVKQEITNGNNIVYVHL
ncbi:hypothetical protein M3Y96_00269600 [Aphelenchoides besseyi]|nr:hypothetical protein M3Y96_00269600 [Aphelenchoides besseyi]